jgi:predicted Fe-Mo cluster-binding NifX family protein
MKILVSAKRADVDALVDPRFGRAQHFILYDTETEKWEAINNNQNQQAAQGAGIQAGQKVVASGAEIVLTGNCGPKAFSVLNEAGVKVCIGVIGTVKQAIKYYENGIYKPADSANVNGHWK